MCCPYHICCHWWLFSKWFDLVGCLPGRLRLGSVAKPSIVIFLHCSLSHSEIIYILPTDSLRLLYMCLSTTACMRLLTMHRQCISNWNSRSRYIQKLVKHWHILPYIVLNPIFLHLSITLILTNTCSTSPFEFHVRQMNSETFGAALTFCCSRVSGSSMPLPCSISDSKSATQACLLSLGLCMVSFQLRQFSVLEMLSGVHFSSLLTGKWSILLIRWIFQIWVHPPGRFFVYKACGKGDLSRH